LVGPLFYYELVRLARKGRSTVLRCAYALTLLAALFLAYNARFPEYDLWSPSLLPAKPQSALELSRLAQGFVYAILRVQTLAVFVLAPVYIGSAIAEERERGTLDLLRMTHLSAREVVLGKLAARVVHLGGVLLAGLPLLALTQIWGGVDFRLLLMAFLASGLNLLSVGAVCVVQSAMFRSTRMAIFASYLVSLGLLLSCTVLAGTPSELFRELSEAMAVSASGPARGRPGPPAAETVIFPALAFWVTANGIAFLCFTTWAIFRLYSPIHPAGEKVAPDDEPTRPREDPGKDVLPPGRPRLLPPVGDSPLLWKEKNRAVGESASTALERLFSKPAVALLLPGLWAAMLFLARREAWDDPDATQTMDVVSRSAAVLLAGLWCGAVAFVAAGGVSGERERRTLDVLLTVPASRAALLGAKWLGAVLSGRAFGYGLAILAAVELVGGDWHPLGTLLLLLAVTSQVALLASVGTWLSLVSRGTLRARVLMALLLLVSAGSLNGLTATRGAPPSWPSLVAGVGNNAPGTWWFLTFTRDDFAAAYTAGGGRFADRLGATAVGVLALALLAGLFWLDTWRRFEARQTG
jgi:ABC-type transport system involved in multi-copper enzyme maturation permease subunit